MYGDCLLDFLADGSISWPVAPTSLHLGKTVATKVVNRLFCDQTILRTDYSERCSCFGPSGLQTFRPSESVIDTEISVSRVFLPQKESAWRKKKAVTLFNTQSRLTCLRRQSYSSYPYLSGADCGFESTCGVPCQHA